MKKSQTDKIFLWLYWGHLITPLQALNKFGCFRLGARIWELRKMGYDIKTQMIKRNGKWVAQYRMER